MNKEDRDWMFKCISEPSKYKIYVDNDMVFVFEVNEDGSDGDDILHTFSTFGEEFIFCFLRALGVNVDYV